MTLEQHLNELGVIARPAPAPKPARPAGPPASWQGIWYPDNNIPH